MYCSAAPYLDIKLPIVCGQCQHADWNADWARKLNRARAFLNELPRRKDRDLKEDDAAFLETAITVISDLIRALEDEYAVSSWGLRTKFPPSGKQPVGRIKAKPDEERKPKGLSKLSWQIRPEDIVDDEWEPTHDQGNDVHADSPPLTYDNPVFTHGGVPWIDELVTHSNEEAAQQSENLFNLDTSDWGTDHDWGAGEEEQQPQRNEEEPSSETITMGTEQDPEPDPGMDQLIKDFWDTVNIDMQQDEVPLMSPTPKTSPVKLPPRESPQIAYLQRQIDKTPVSDRRHYALKLEMRRYQIWDLENTMPQPRQILFPTEDPRARK